MGCLSSKEQTEIGQTCSIFLMVNGSSGGRAAQALLDMDSPEFEFTAKKTGKLIRVFTYSLKDNEEREKGFAKLKQEAKSIKESKSSDRTVRVVACGGDGTVKWVISELSKVSCLDVPIGVIPFGTGNDHSRAFGWGSSAPSPLIGGKQKTALKSRMEMIADAEICPLDTWICSITVKKEIGRFKEVKDAEVVQTHQFTDTIEHEMINYLSCGADAQIVFEFEKNRTNSQLGNKLVYVRKGGKQFVVRPKRLRKMVDVLKGESGKRLSVREKDRVLAFLNIPSYSAGANIWRPGKGQSGSFGSQYVGDKKLECCTVHTVADVGLHIASGGTSYMGVYRVGQEGSYDIGFQDKAKVYIQVDGEAILAENLDSIKVRHGYQVNVLRSPKAIARPTASGGALSTAVSNDEEIVVEEEVASDNEDEEEDEEEEEDEQVQDKKEEEVEEEEEEQVQQEELPQESNEEEEEEEELPDLTQNTEEFEKAARLMQGAFRKKKQQA